jgi:putative nucleotidyltransferase with HDIG domain
LAVGVQFGVVIVLEENCSCEVSTFRSDGVYEDGRHPREVTYTRDAQQDVLRRDFTLNGLLYDPLQEVVLDFVGGQQDIKDGIIRAIGNSEQRFLEDKLRLLRAVRFAARFNYRIEPETKQAMLRLAPRVLGVSAERIREELLKILTGGYAARGFQLLDDCLLLKSVLPEISSLKGVAQPPEFHPEGDVWTHTLLMLSTMDQTKNRLSVPDSGTPWGDKPASRHRFNDSAGDSTHSELLPGGEAEEERISQYPTATLALAVLFHDIGKPSTFELKDRIRFNNHAEAGARMAASICERLRMSNKQAIRIEALVRDHLKFIDLHRMRLATLKRFLWQEGFREHLELHRLDCLASHGKLDNWHFARAALNRIGPAEIKPPRLLSGDTLIEMGYHPGPEFQAILKSVEDAQLDGHLHTMEEARQFVLSQFAKG